MRPERPRRDSSFYPDKSERAAAPVVARYREDAQVDRYWRSIRDLSGVT